MRIAQVCPYDIDRPGGVQAHIRDMAAALTALGHEVTIIAPKMAGSDDESVVKGVRIVRIGCARKIRFSGTAFEISLVWRSQKRRLAAVLRQGDFDCIHYHTIWTPFLPLQVFLRAHAPAVATFHDTPPLGLAGRMLYGMFLLLSRLLLPRIGGLIAVSELPGRHLRPPRGRRVHVIPPCTDLARFQHVLPAPAGVPLNILFVGRLETRKGAGVLIQAYAAMRARGVAARLTIAGTGPEEAALKDLAARGLVPDVTFLGAFADAAAPGLFAAADIVCAPSLYGESFGIVIAEAMASGRPVAAAANAGYRTLLTGEAARFLTPPGDVEALANALTLLANDVGLRARLGAWGRREALAYDCTSIVPRLLAVYAEAIAAKTPVLQMAT